MIFRAIDSDGDWQFGRGKGNYLTGDAAIGANVNTRIRSWLNDCFFDMKAGIDWLNRLGLKNQRQLLEADLRRIISQSYGVSSILSLSTAQTGRKFSAQYTIQTINSKSYTDSITLGG